MRYVPAPIGQNFIFPLRSVVLGLAAALTVSLPSQSFAGAKAPKAPPAEVKAHYKISLSGFDLGTFDFEHKMRGRTYSLKSVVELSALLGVFEWRGITHTTGDYSAAKAVPVRYAFDYRSKSKGGMVRMDFKNGDVATMSAYPGQPAGANFVPLERGHTKSVLDPLSAILSIVTVDQAEVCGRRFAILDGKQRFNLALRFRRYEALAPSRPGAPPQRGIICQIKYTPVAGYTPNKDTKAFAAEENIEIAFRPIPHAGVMVPYRMTLPTVVGTAKLELAKLAIRSARDRLASAR
jgi:Protein of unknown function (DUF3108)